MILEQTIEEIQRSFGKEAIKKLEVASKVEVISSGIDALDNILGVGGLPRGRIIEVYGPESSGKTTVALQAIAEVQKQGRRAAFIDAEHSLNPIYASEIGVHIDELLLSQPSCGEEALEIAEALICSSVIDLIVIDSVAALVPKAELEGRMIDDHDGLQASMMSKAIRRLSGVICKSNTIVIFLNQTRSNSMFTIGSGEFTTGGDALKFYSSIRLELRNVGYLYNNNNKIGTIINATTVKNKVSTPFKQCKINLFFEKGVKSV
jgi:recombination protein RecA